MTTDTQPDMAHKPDPHSLGVCRAAHNWLRSDKCASYRPPLSALAGLFKWKPAANTQEMVVDKTYDVTGAASRL